MSVINPKAFCWCLTCRPLGPFRMEMVVCPDCGCKRCPRADSHEAACTGKIVAAKTPSGVTHTCSGCVANRAMLDAAVERFSAARQDEPK